MWDAESMEGPQVKALMQEMHIHSGAHTHETDHHAFHLKTAKPSHYSNRPQMSSRHEISLSPQHGGSGSLAGILRDLRKQCVPFAVLVSNTIDGTHNMIKKMSNE